MEKKISKLSLSESQFIELLEKVRQGDKNASLQIIYFFENDIIAMSRYIKMPKEDAIQSITLELLQLLRSDSAF